MKHYVFYQCDLLDIKAPRLERNYEEWGGMCYPGIARWGGPFKLQFKRPMSELEDMVHLWSSTEKAAFRLVFDDGTTFTFDAFVWEVMTGDEPSISLRMTGPVEVREGRRNPAPMEEKPMAPTRRKKLVINKFYVASDSMLTEQEQGTPNTLVERGRGRHVRWAKFDVKQAIDHATSILEADPSKDHVAIVKIIKVVRRKKMPVIVENV